MKPKFFQSFLLAAGSSLLAVSSASAQTWDGGGADTNWSSGLNWNTNVAPVSGASITFAGTTRAVNVNDLTADTLISGINFTNTTAAQLFSISGARITLGGNIVTSASSGAGITDTVSLAMILNGDRTITTGNLHNLTLSGVISETGGARSLTKSGAGTLSITTNMPTYTGATIIQGGTFNVNSFTSGTVLPNTSGIQFTTASSTFAASAGGTSTVTYPTMDIASGISATFAKGSSGNNTPYAIPSLTGSGTFVYTNPGGSGTGTSVTFTTLANFDGNLQVSQVGGIINTPNLKDVASSKVILTAGSTSVATAFNFNGSSNLTLNNRQFELSGATANGLHVINNNGTGATSAFVINTDLSVTSGTARTLRFGGTNTASTSTFGGIIPNGTSAVISLQKNDASTWTLSNDNTFGGSVTVSGGTLSLTGVNQYTGATTFGSGATLSFNSIKDYGVASSLGKPASGDIAISTFGAANLIYLGSGDTSNRTISYQGDVSSRNNNSGIFNNGSGALIFSAATFNTSITGFSGRTNNLILGGSYTGGASEIQGKIQDNVSGALIGITKNNDNSLWRLSGANSYTGATIVNGGTLLIGRNAPVSADGALGNAASEVTLGVAGGNTAARLLTDGAFTVGRSVRLPTNNTTATLI